MAYYKAFKKGMICNGKQYAENADFEEQGAESCCKAGVMHFCESPMDVLNYYPLVDENGDFSEFATVEPLDKVIKKEDKCASKRIHIGAKLGFKGFIEAAVVVCAGKRAKIKAHKGTWITLAEYGEFDGEGYPCICVKSAQIDGETLKCDTWYTLENGEFVEAD